MSVPGGWFSSSPCRDAQNFITARNICQACPNCSDTAELTSQHPQISVRHRLNPSVATFKPSFTPRCNMGGEGFPDPAPPLAYLSSTIYTLQHLDWTPDAMP